MIRQAQPGRVRRNTTAATPKSAAVANLLNKAILHDVFDVDDGDDSDDLLIIGENVCKNNQRKKIETVHQVLKASDNTICQRGAEKFGQKTVIESSNDDDGKDLVILGEKVSEGNKGKKTDDIHQIVKASDNTICKLGVEKFGQINVDDSKDLVIIDEKSSKSNKGKTVEATHQIVEVSNSSFCQSGVENFGLVSGTETSNGYPSASRDLVNIDCHGSDLSYEDGYNCKDLVIIGEEVCQSNKGKQIEALHEVVEVSDYTSCQPEVKSFGSVILHDVIDINDDGDDDNDDDLVIIDEVSKSKKEKTIEAIHQAVEHLDNVDTPCGIEAPVTLLPESDLGSRKNTSESNFLHDTQSDATNSHVRTSSQNSRSLESNCSEIHGLARNPSKSPTSTNFESATKAASICNSSSMNQVILDNINIPGRTEAPFTLFSESGIGLRSTFESSTWYNTQSEATNSNPSKSPTSTNFENATKAASACNSSSMNRAQLNDTQSEASNSPSTTSSRSSQSLERDNSKNQGSTMGVSNLQNKIDNTYRATMTHLSYPPPLFYQATPNKRKSTTPNPSTSANFESAKKTRLNIPCGVEAPFTSFSESNLGSKLSTFISCTRYNTHLTTSYQASQSLQRDNSNNQGFTIGSSNLQSPSTSSLSSPPLFYQATPNKKKSTAPNPPISANFERAKKACLDNVDIPRVVEAPFTLLPESIQNSRQSTSKSSTPYGTQSKTTSHSTTSSQPSRSLEHDNSKNQGSTIGGSSLHNKTDISYHSTGICLSFPPPLVYQATPNKRKSTVPTSSTSANFESAKKARLDNVDIPREIEASFSSFPESILGSRKSTIESSTRLGSQSKAANSHLMASSQPSRLPELARSFTPGSTMGSPTLQIEMDNPDHSFGTGFSASQLYSRAALSKKKSAVPQRTQSSNSKTFLNSFHSPTESVSFGSKNRGLFRNSEAVEPQTSYNFQKEPFTMFSSYSESPSPLFPQTVSFKKKTTKGKKATDSSSKESCATSSSKPSRSLDFVASNSIITMGNVAHSYGTGLSSPLLLTQGAASKKKSEAAASKKKSEAAAAKKKSEAAAAKKKSEAAAAKKKSEAAAAKKKSEAAAAKKKSEAAAKKKSEAAAKQKFDPPKKLLQATGLSSPLLLTQGVSSKKKSDSPKKLLLGTGSSCPLLLTQGAPSKKKSEASSSKKKSLTATSKKKSDPPKKLLQATGLSSPLLLTHTATSKKKSEASSSKKKSQAASSKKKSASPKKLLQASKSSNALQSKSFKQITGSSPSQLSQSLVLSNSSATESSSMNAPSCLLLEYKWQVL